MTQDEIIEMAEQAGFEIDCCSLDWHKRITAFAHLVAAKEREALAQPEQEPACCNGNCPNTKDCEQAMQCLYATPPQRTWVGLTDEEMLEAIKPLYANPFLAHNALEVSRDEYQAIEAKLNEKNT